MVTSYAAFSKGSEMTGIGVKKNPIMGIEGYIISPQCHPCQEIAVLIKGQ